MKSRSHLIIGTLSTIEFSILTGTDLTPLTISLAAFLSIIPDLDEPNSNVMKHVISKRTTNRIHSIILYSLLLLCFYIYTKTNQNLYIGLLLSLIFIIFLEKKITANKTRSVVISLLFLSIGFVLLFLKINIGIITMFFLISMFPIFKHRSFTHSLSIVVIIFAVFMYLQYIYRIKNLAIIGTFAYLSHLACDIITKRGIPIFYPFSKKYFSIGNLRVGFFLCNIVEYITIAVLIVLILYQLA